MNLLIKNIIPGIVMLLGFSHCSKNEQPPPVDPEPTEQYKNVTIEINQKKTYQTIEGFGFFGAYDVWWGNADNLWNDAWGEKIINDLGVTIWRNEIYPPANQQASQDADWTKQLPVVRGLKAKSDKLNVPLKFVATVWSPPAEMKWAANFSWAGDTEATRWENTDVTTKNGGTLSPEKYSDYTSWLNEHIRLYKNEGIDLYALSLQNEPAFSQSFNSCTYTTKWYNDLLINVVPGIKKSFPNIQIFGSENMLLTEGKEENWRWFYHSGIKANEDAAKNLDILAVHGYSDGVLPSSGAELVNMWKNHSEQFSIPMNKKAWMSETSGYSEAWEINNGKSGALNLALDMMTALNYGNITAWIWWQGSQLDGIGDYNLMKGLETGKKYAVSKHYYRYIRPDAIRTEAKVLSDEDEVFVTSFKHEDKKTTTIVIINVGETKSISIKGDNLPAEFTMYRTSNSNTERCTLIGTVKSGIGEKFILPENSIVTLLAGSDAL